jgi:hypothetical protein
MGVPSDILTRRHESALLQDIYEHFCPGRGKLLLYNLSHPRSFSRKANLVARHGRLGKDSTLVEVPWMQCLHRDTGVLPPLQYGMFDGRWTTQIGKQRRMHVQAAVLRIVKDPWWNKETE